MIDNLRLLELSEVSGSLFVELSPGKYEQGQCWSRDSIYVAEEVFGYLETVVTRNVPGYSHWAFSDVTRSQWVPILQDFSQLAAQLETANDFNEVRSDLGFLFIHSASAFESDFVPNARALAQLIRELVVWVGLQLKSHDGVAILGI